MAAAARVGSAADWAANEFARVDVASAAAEVDAADAGSWRQDRCVAEAEDLEVPT